MAIVQSINLTYLQSGLTEMSLNIIIDELEIASLYNLTGKRVSIVETVELDTSFHGMPPSLIINNHNFSELKSFSNK